MKRKLLVSLAISVCLAFLFISNLQAAITSNETGTHDGYDYEFWKDSGGSGSMTLGSGGTFSCEWSNINNILFRKGRKFDETKTHQQLGNISIDYGVDYHPSGNSYLCIYGWTTDPLVEYYIVESWGSWRPPGATSKGTITVDGGTYDIYETTRTNQPSIIGTATFQQYWSVRRTKRTSGTVSVSEHFNAWESRGMPMGNMYEVALTVEGYQSSGWADVYRNTLTIGGSGPQPPEEPEPPEAPDSRSAFTTIQAEEYNSLNSSTIEIIGTANGGSGIGYIESGDTVTFSNIDFENGASEFTALVASDVSNTGIEIRLNSAYGTLLGTLSVGSTGGWNNYTELSTEISNVTGVHDLVLCFSGPVNVDWFTFSRDGNVDPEEGLGDVNDDGLISASDYVLIQRHILGLENVSSNADVDRDGSIGSVDLVLVRKYILGQISSFPEIKPPTPSGTFHCFLLLGQSNMAGWPQAEASDKVTNPRIFELGYDNNQWEVACPPLHESWQEAIGPGDWFAKTLIKELPEGDTIGLIPCAISGERIETFMKNIGSKYNWIIERGKIAQQRGGVIEGILFHQGESNNGQTDWPNKVNTLMEDIKNDLGLGDIPILVGELLYSGSCSGHNTLVNQLPFIVENCHVISAEGLSGDPTDEWGLHFNHDSQVELGQRYARKMIELLDL